MSDDTLVGGVMQVAQRESDMETVLRELEPYLTGIERLDDGWFNVKTANQWESGGTKHSIKSQSCARDLAEALRMAHRGAMKEVPR